LITQNGTTWTQIQKEKLPLQQHYNQVRRLQQIQSQAALRDPSKPSLSVAMVREPDSHLGQ